MTKHLVNSNKILPSPPSPPTQFTNPVTKGEKRRITAPQKSAPGPTQITTEHSLLNESSHFSDQPDQTGKKTKETSKIHLMKTGMQKWTMTFLLFPALWPEN